MLIYFDICSLQRPYDDRSQQRVADEADAMERVIVALLAGDLNLVSSSALRTESAQNTDALRQQFIDSLLAEAVVEVDALTVEAKRVELVAAGVRPMDAAHVACAVKAQADYFCTCDDRLLRKAKALVVPPPNVVSPLELVEELGL